MPATMTPKEFVAKWEHNPQKETAVSQSHFNDVCALVGHAPPISHDPSGRAFSFETKTVKSDGSKGFADVFYKGKFIWEYKGPHKNLKKAYRQLQLYREDLENPPLLITSDTQVIHIHTNFNNYPTQKHVVTMADIADGRGVKTLQNVFYRPESFKPQKTQQQITKASAETFIAVADAMKQHQRIMGESYSAEQLAHFLVRLLFSLFAEDLGLLPDNLFTKIIKSRGEDYRQLENVFSELFAKMRSGGQFGLWSIRHFNGTLFDDDFVPSIPHDLGMALIRAAEQDWSEVDPSIFGTLFERVIDEKKRAQLGAHYTSEDDIMLIVEPVLMEPLKRQWDDVRRKVDRELRHTSGEPSDTAVSQAHQQLLTFAQEIASTTVLDPACGSGNFLYVALRELLNLQKQVIAYAARKELPEIPLTVSPEQLYGIEINPYAHELAQITAWIGYLQWRHENGFDEIPDPVLRPLHNIQRMDAILAYDEDGRPVEPDWPAADVIIGNPPFLGGKKTVTELGSSYMADLRQVYEGRLPGFSDLVTYWFERSRIEIEKEKIQRAGLIATNSISMGTNLPVLKRIKENGNIFFAWDDRSWILDGAAVRVAIVAFDNGSETRKQLNGLPVEEINSDLTAGVNLTKAQQLYTNLNIAFIGTQKSGPFDIKKAVAHKFLEAQNEDGSSNAEVVRPWVNGSDIVRRPRGMYIIYFPEHFQEEDAKRYKAPFEHVSKHVRSSRTAKHFAGFPFWLHWRARPALNTAAQQLSRYIITPRVSKHRLFVWMSQDVVPDSATVAIAREDDYFFGVLHGRPHEIWALRLGTWLGKGNDPRYTPTTTFETYPFPWPPGQEPSEEDSPLVAEIAHWARELVQWRQAWLNPPRDGMYAGVNYDKMLKKRTLTNLYNGLVYYRETVRANELFIQKEFDKVTRKAVTRAEIQELDDIHRALDEAVLDAYGWPRTLTDEQILEKLLALNLERAAQQAKS